jgi:hypothetical protein
VESFPVVFADLHLGVEELDVLLNDWEVPEDNLQLSIALSLIQNS